MLEVGKEAHSSLKVDATFIRRRIGCLDVKTTNVVIMAVIANRIVLHELHSV
jgi:hypothetical protein